MHHWVIPYIDQPIEFWDDLQAHFGDLVEEVYFPMPQGWIASGRSRQPEAYLETFLRKARLPKAVLVNPIVIPEPVEQIGPRLVAKLTELSERYGVTGVTITNLELARLVREALPSVRITASCLMSISTPAQAMLLNGVVDSLTPDTRLSHDLPALQRLKSAFEGRIRLLVNESCLPGCPMRVQHFYEMGYSQTFPRSLCEKILDQAPWLRMTGGWILPQHLQYYDGVFDSLKLAGRVTLKDPNRYRQVFAAYTARTSLLPVDVGGGPASILAPIDIPDALFETILRCEKNCHACRVCRDYYTAHAGA